MGGYDPNNYDDVTNYLNFPNDSDDEEDEQMTPRPDENQNMEQAQDVKGIATPLSPPASSAEGDGEAIDEDELDEDDLYGGPTDDVWKDRRNSDSVGEPVNPQWLLSSNPPRLSISQSENRGSHPSPPSSDEGKTPTERRTILDTIQERNEGQLIKTSTTAKSSKSFPLLPDLLSLKQAEDEDEKILQSEEGKRLNPRERRQLRNKVSARNFRVRRKEYIGHLESLVESQTQEIESLRQTLSQVQLENTQLRQESGFLRSIALNHQQPQSSSQPQSEPPMSHPNKDINPNTFEWPLAYDGSQSPTQPNNNKFADRPMFGGHIHAYGVRVPEVQFDKPHLQSPSNSLAPPLPPPPAPHYSPNSPRSAQDAATTPPGQPTLPPGAENLGYPGMLQAVSYLYDYIVKASNPTMMQPPQQQPAPGYPMQPAPYHPQPQPWGDAKVMGAPIGFNSYMNGNWGWGGGPPGPPV